MKVSEEFLCKNVCNFPMWWSAMHDKNGIENENSSEKDNGIVCTVEVNWKEKITGWP